MKEINRDDVFGVKQYLFELMADADSAAGEGQTQVHPCDGADASQQQAYVHIKTQRKHFHWTYKLEMPKSTG